jgi:hypothetical protein
MTTAAPVPIASASSPVAGRPRLLRWVSTSNPFYVLSAGLFLAGLWISFGAQAEEVQTWALMAGLAGYTLLLAVTACFLVRFGNVWDDVRTLLLLVVLLFLATSVTFDEVLVFDPARGFLCYLLGLAFAILVSEGLLRGIRLALPAFFRVPYYLILSLFFLYPLALRPFLTDPHSEELMWGLFGFAPLAGLLFLTLLPAIRRGPDYVRDNGSPWRWPLYPWVLFGVLAFAVPARSFLLCWSMQLLEAGDGSRLLFGPFVIAPFGLALAVLLLEIGLVSQRRAVQWAGLAIPIILLALLVGWHREDPIYRQFLAVFTDRVGEPLTVLLTASALFFGYAAMRRVSLATEALTAALVLLAFVGPQTLDQRQLVSPQPSPLLAAALLQLLLGGWRRISWRCLLGTGLLLASVLTFAEDQSEVFLYGVLAFHLAVFTAFVLGALFDDPLVRGLRYVAGALVVLVCWILMAANPGFARGLPPAVLVIYPLLMALFLAGYGRLFRQVLFIVAGLFILTGWFAVAGWRGYGWLRQLVGGLDQMLLSLALFAVAVLVSLTKSGALPRWFGARRRAIARLQRALDARPAWSGESAVSPQALRPARNQVRQTP